MNLQGVLDVGLTMAPEEKGRLFAKDGPVSKWPAFEEGASSQGPPSPSRYANERRGNQDDEYRVQGLIGIDGLCVPH
jgi:hypothetical protein